MVVMMMTVFATFVVAVNPVMPVFTPMTRDPDHFPVACPISGAMSVIGTVPDLDPNVGGPYRRG